MRNWGPAVIWVRKNEADVLLRWTLLACLRGHQSRLTLKCSKRHSRSVAYAPCSDYTDETSSLSNLQLFCKWYKWRIYESSAYGSDIIWSHSVSVATPDHLYRPGPWIYFHVQGGFKRYIYADLATFPGYCKIAICCPPLLRDTKPLIEFYVFLLMR